MKESMSSTKAQQIPMPQQMKEGSIVGEMSGDNITEAGILDIIR